MHEAKRGDRLVDIDEVLPSGSAFRVWRIAEDPGGLTAVEMMTLCCLASSRRPRKVLEWGTGRGVAAANVVINAPEAQVYTVAAPVRAETAWITGPATYAYHHHPLEETRIHQVYGVLPDFDFWQVGRGVDLCLIHSRSGDEARMVTARVLPLMVHPGLILWHDVECVDAPRPNGCGTADFLREMEPSGVAFVRGTSLARVAVALGVRHDMAARLGYELEE